jgi:hypothetical protein
MRRVLVAVLVAVGLTAGACGGGGSADPKFYGITHDAYQVLPDPLTDTPASRSRWSTTPTSR